MLKWISIHFKRAGISCEKPKNAFSEAAMGVVLLKKMFLKFFAVFIGKHLREPLF